MRGVPILEARTSPKFGHAGVATLFPAGSALICRIALSSQTLTPFPPTDTATTSLLDLSQHVSRSPRRSLSQPRSSHPRSSHPRVCCSVDHAFVYNTRLARRNVHVEGGCGPSRAVAVGAIAADLTADRSGRSRPPCHRIRCRCQLRDLVTLPSPRGG